MLLQEVTCVAPVRTINSAKVVLHTFLNLRRGFWICCAISEIRRSAPGASALRNRLKPGTKAIFLIAMNEKDSDDLVLYN